VTLTSKLRRPSSTATMMAPRYLAKASAENGCNASTRPRKLNPGVSRLMKGQKDCRAPSARAAVNMSRGDRIRRTACLTAPQAHGVLDQAFTGAGVAAGLPAPLIGQHAFSVMTRDTAKVHERLHVRHLSIAGSLSLSLDFSASRLYLAHPTVAFGRESHFLAPSNPAAFGTHAQHPFVATTESSTPPPCRLQKLDFDKLFNCI
jgi:hypothetical protein